MPYVIALAVIYLCLNWLREKTGLSWEAFIAITGGLAVLVVGALVWDTLRAEEKKPQQPAQPSPDDGTLDPYAPPGRLLQDAPYELRNWQQVAPGDRLMLQYRDDEGVETERAIQPKAISGTSSGDGRVRPNKVWAFCELRRDIRTFRLEQMLSVRNAQTGQAVDDPYSYFGSAQPGGCPPKRDPRRPVERPPSIVAPIGTPDLILRYRDAREVTSYRTVKPRQLRGIAGPAGLIVEPHLRAFCLEAKAIRTFKLERIESAALAETGEVVEDLYHYLANSRLSVPPPSPKSPARRVSTRNAGIEGPDNSSAK